MWRSLTWTILAEGGSIDFTGDRNPSMRIMFIYTDIGISVGYSCGIGVLSSYLKQHGHDTRLIHVSDELDYPFDPERIVRDVKAYDPGLIAFSAVTNQWYFVKQLAKFIRRELDTPIVVGGHHANAVPEQVIAERSVDFACKGEGEAPVGVGEPFGTGVAVRRHCQHGDPEESDCGLQPVLRRNR